MPFNKPRKNYDEAALYHYAIGALGRRMRTVAELKRLLRARAPEGDSGEAMIDSVISMLKERKYLNDSQYASTYSTLRRDNNRFGQGRVITDLKVKGVHADVIEKAVQDTFSGIDEIQQARAFLAKKRMQKPSNDREAAKIFRALMRAGFRSGTAISVLKEWNIEDEVLTAFEEQGPGE
ncbi:MAG TPA: RecX family transcriptional regulator [Candidatus Angelobacter sp.]|nr:RecX family transcriptional regulator [Candidatus Angelobacter sp.]